MRMPFILRDPDPTQTPGSPPPGTPPPGTPPPGSPPPGTPPPPVPYFTGLYDDKGSIDPKSLDRLPEHLKPYKDLLGRYKTVDELLAGFGNASSLASKKALAPLDPNAPDGVKAERKQLLDTILNVPKDAKGYGLAKPKELPDEFWNQEVADKFGGLALKHSLSPDAVRELLALQIEATNGEVSRGKAAETEYYTGQDAAFETEMKKQGIALDKAVDLAKRGAGTLGIDPASPIFKNAAVRQAMVRFANLVAEDTLIKGGLSGDEKAGGEVDQARDIIGNPQNPLYKAFHDGNDPRNEQAKARVTELYRISGERARKQGGL